MIDNEIDEFFYTRDSQCGQYRVEIGFPAIDINEK